MWLRMGVGGNARPIGFIGRPIDEAGVMFWDEDRPFGAWQLAGLPFAPPGRIERDLTARFSVDIGARVSRVCQHMINRRVAWVDPPDRCTIMGLHRKGKALAAQLKQDPTDRTEFGRAGDEGVLARVRFAILRDLCRTALSKIYIREAGEMRAVDLGEINHRPSRFAV